MQHSNNCKREKAKPPFLIHIVSFRWFLAASLACLVVTGCLGVEDETEKETPVYVPQEPPAAAAPESDTTGASSIDDPASAGMASGMSGMGKMSMPNPEEIVFKDDAESNVTPPVGLDGLVFVNTDGVRVTLNEYLGKSNVLLVFTEGFSGMLCPFCKTQTARLVANYESFRELETEILVVYPGERDHLDEFIEAARTTDKGQLERVPFPIVLDPRMEAVEFFNIKSRLAHPSTYIIDRRGRIQFAYVGKDMSADRPSVKALLRAVAAAANREKNGE